MNVTCIAYFRLPLAPNIAVELLTLLLPNREVTAGVSILGLTMLVEIFCSFPRFLPRSFHLINPFINCHITQH
jgi:cellulose synthase/poly-beta-1,6-N-acetylglucosamine synthase-like glycosyltransferase